MRKRVGLWVAAALLFLCFSARGDRAPLLRADPMLSCAFSMLEEGNPFQERYNEITGEAVASRLSQGIPYLWGGMSASHVFAKAPEYVVLPASSSSPVYYKAGQKYLYGFDCIGFIRYVRECVKGDTLPMISDMLYARSLHRWDDQSANPPPLRLISAYLKAGDLLVMEHPGYHIAMFIGTLRRYGYTEKEVPELAAYLDYPLVIHSSVNAQIARRFEDYLKKKAAEFPKYLAATVTDGGVCVSILLPSRENAPFTVTSQEQLTSYFPLPDGTWLTVLPWEEVVRYAWLRV